MNKAKAYREIQKRQSRGRVYHDVCVQESPSTTPTGALIALESDAVREQLIEMLKSAATAGPHATQAEMEIFGVKRYQPMHSLNHGAHIRRRTSTGPYPPDHGATVQKVCLSSQTVQARATTSDASRKGNWSGTGRPSTVQAGTTLQSKLDALITPSQYRRLTSGQVAQSPSSNNNQMGASHGSTPSPASGMRGRKLTASRTEPMLNVRTMDKPPAVGIGASPLDVSPNGALIKFPVASKIRQVLVDIPSPDMSTSQPAVSGNSPTQGLRKTPMGTNSSLVKTARPAARSSLLLHPPARNTSAPAQQLVRQPTKSDDPQGLRALLLPTGSRREVATRQASFLDMDTLRFSSSNASISLEQPLALTSKNVEMFTNMLSTQALRVPSSNQEDRVEQWVRERRLMSTTEPSTHHDVIHEVDEGQIDEGPVNGHGPVNAHMPVNGHVAKRKEAVKPADGFEHGSDSTDLNNLK